MAATVNRLTSSGVRARANRRRAVGNVTSSRVRMEMMQATSCSKGERKPSSASSKSAALGNGRTASRMRRNAWSISNGRLMEAASPLPGFPISAVQHGSDSTTREKTSEEQGFLPTPCSYPTGPCASIFAGIRVLRSYGHNLNRKLNANLNDLPISRPQLAIICLPPRQQKELNCHLTTSAAGTYAWIHFLSASRTSDCIVL